LETQGFQEETDENVFRNKKEVKENAPLSF